MGTPEIIMVKTAKSNINDILKNAKIALKIRNIIETKVILRPDKILQISSNFIFLCSLRPAV